MRRTEKIESTNSRRLFLQRMLGSGMALGTSSSWLPLLSGCAVSDTKRSTSIPLSPAIDLTTGLPLLLLPQGFSYFSFAWAGERMRDQSVIPRAADGMCVIGQQQQRVRLARNHEIWADVGQYTNTIPAYDPGAGGGVVMIELDLATRAIETMPGLAGTVANCSGGRIEPGMWLSCEELVHVPGTTTLNFDGSPATKFTKPHGFVFESGANASNEPLWAMGQFRHEGLTQDIKTGMIYLTEDNKPAGLYRFTPKDRNVLAAGGVLEVLQVEGHPDLRDFDRTGLRLKARWVRIEQPVLGHSAGTNDQSGVIKQGIDQGASLFSRLEGICMSEGVLYFNSTDGGPAKAGQIFAYYPDREEVELIYASRESRVMDYPDQMCLAPDQGLYIAQDSKKAEQQAIWWLGSNQNLLPFALNNTEIEGRSYRDAEWSGLCFSPDGEWLFANIYTPGFTVAITGPWKQWRASQA